MENLIATLMIWIGTNTSYNIDNIPHPEVKLLSQHQMTEEYFNGSNAPRPKSGSFSGIIALYNKVDTENGIVYLLDPRLNSALSPEMFEMDDSLTDLEQPLHRDWLDNPVFQEQLLHELIHHVQYQTGTVDSFPCRAFAEKEAYLLGGKYLQLRHARDPIMNRKVLAHMYSRC